MSNFAPYDKPQWGSDVMVDALRALGLRYVSLNPGSSFRGLHDSLVNYGDDITMIECPHEKIALGVAHGYAKVTGEPMAVVLHDLVGLLHGTIGIYYAYIDRVPVIILGGSGPAAHERRRPNIDWIHSANVQGQAVRPYTKWDHEPRSLASVPTVLGRGLPDRRQGAPRPGVCRARRGAPGGCRRHARAAGGHGAHRDAALAHRPRPAGARRARPGAVRRAAPPDGARVPGACSRVLRRAGRAG